MSPHIGWVHDDVRGAPFEKTIFAERNNPKMDGLTKGRNVHYVTDEGDHHAAIVTKIWDRDEGMVNLCVFAESGEPYARTSVRYAEADPDAHEKLPPYTWHWIEKA